MYNEKICQRLLRWFPRLTEAVWNHPTSRLMFKSIILRQDFKLWGQKLEPKYLTTVDVPGDVTLSVRGATRLHSKTGGQGFFKCPCQTTCLTETLPKAQRTRGLSSSCHSNFLRSYHKFKNNSWSHSIFRISTKPQLKISTKCQNLH